MFLPPVKDYRWKLTTAAAPPKTSSKYSALIDLSFSALFWAFSDRAASWLVSLRAGLVCLAWSRSDPGMIQFSSVTCRASSSPIQ